MSRIDPRTGAINVRAVSAYERAVRETELAMRPPLVRLEEALEKDLPFVLVEIVDGIPFVSTSLLKATIIQINANELSPDDFKRFEQMTDRIRAKTKSFA